MHIYRVLFCSRIQVLGINKYNPCSEVKSRILISETDSNVEIIWSINWFQVISSTEMCCRGECTIFLGKSREGSEGGGKRNLNKEKVTDHSKVWESVAWNPKCVLLTGWKAGQFVNRMGKGEIMSHFRKWVEARLDGLFWVTISNLIFV